MSKEYIERGALLKDITERCSECDARFEGRICQQCEVRDDIEIIRKAPAADVVEVKHGHREEIEPVTITVDAQCCRCGIPMGSQDNYCPNCGAKMDGEA